jgi:methionine-rich copper-binding protein CopC
LNQESFAMVIIRIALALGIAAGLAAPALAHSAMKYATPAPGAKLRAAPAAIDITFTEAVAPGLSGIVVQDAAGRQVDKADAKTIDIADTHMRVDLPPLPPGSYRVLWHAVSADDGHHTEGEYRFTIAPKR